MLNFLGQAIVTALKVTATRAANDACRTGYNAAKRKLAQKRGGSTSGARKVTTSAKARDTNSAKARTTSPVKSRTANNKSAPRKYSGKANYKRR